ncbi:MAG: hydrogenase iron-sulfur subunit, partial [Desulfobacterales bacterium]|nr:hydrogenase iron-sulfur subunit [Desulfobacterales bacterium]
MSNHGYYFRAFQERSDIKERGRSAFGTVHGICPMKGKFEPLILVFCCNYCPSCSVDLAGSLKMQYPSNIRIVKVSCIGAVGT